MFGWLSSGTILQMSSTECILKSRMRFTHQKLSIIFLQLLYYIWNFHDTSLRELHWWAGFECFRKCVILLFPPGGIKQTYLKGVAWYLSILNTITFDLLRELLLSADSRFCCLLYSSCCEVYCCLMKLI